VPCEWNATRTELVLKTEGADATTLREVGVRQLTDLLARLGAKSIGAATVGTLYDAGYTTLGDLSKRLQVSELIKLPGIKQSKAQNIYDSIKGAVGDADCLKLMQASNAFGSGLGEKKLRLIHDRYPAIDNEPSIKQLTDIDGVGKKIAENYITGLKRFREFVSEAGVTACD
jgi:Holliday junction resolvasome RuvABC DNA-binding subunit